MADEKPSEKPLGGGMADEKLVDRQALVLKKQEELLEIINKAGKIKLDDAAKKIGLKPEQVAKLAELLRRSDKIKVNFGFLKEPEFEILSSEAERPEEKKPKPGEVEVQKEVEVARPSTKEEPPKKEVDVEKYDLVIGNVRLPARVVDTGDYVYHYMLSMPHIDFVTKALLDEVKRSLVGEIQIETRDIVDTEKFSRLKARFLVRSKEKLKTVLKKASEEQIELLSKIVVDEMIGLGNMEYLLSDDFVEDIVVNSSKDVVWIYHKKYGWLKTNILIPTEDMIRNYSSRIAREVGREITHLQPLLDAHLISGDRVNATLTPISSFGNTISIRRFSRVPWTMIHLLDPKVKTISLDAAAFLWLAIEYECSILVAGGTASGKTSMLNALMPFMPANQRILSMEDTRELNLPEYLHWVPMSIRAPNPQGEGEVSMLDLIVNALRMRPDRIIVGEVRRKREAEVLFEAMHTGHSVYGTFHAEQAYEVVDRITSPPMEIPGQVMKSLHLIVVQYRNRRTGQRRTFEITELTKEGEGNKPGLNTLFKWQPKSDMVEPLYPSVRIKDALELFGGLTEKETQEDLAGKKDILKWMLEKNIRNVNDVGKIVAQYYVDRNVVLDAVRGNKPQI
ncbi:MAG: hypothetical protein FJY77_03910 [Candidatus Altiarchaeales archaeon]|nr:hypothetical protein [Candidatus Altiarchaeales archaeon]